MSDSLMEKTTLDVPADFEKGRHFDFIKSTIPECLVQASPLRRKVLKDTKPTVPLWYENSSTDQRSALKALMEIDCHAQNNWDKTLAAVDSVTTFAKPLLTTALAEADIDLDVEKTWVRLYYPVDYEFFGIATGVSTGDVRSRTFSLLQAALHNFETFEAEEGYFDKDSSFITGPDTQGRFDVIDSTLKIQQFVAICRELDIGGQYQKFINKFLYEGGAAHEQALSLAFIDSKKSAMKAAAYAALLKGDIELAHHELIVALINEQDVVKDKDSRRPISYSPLSLMGYEIAECAVFFPTHANRYDGSYVIAYIPDDPEHSIKKYASFADFEEQLTHQLMYRPPGSRIDSAKDALTDYQRFFSRFISEKDRGHFFLRFTEKVLDAPSGTYWKDQVRGYLKYVSPASRLVGPVADRHWRRDPVENIDLHAKLSLNFQWVGMAGIWTEMFRQKRRHLREDAQVLAVSTATEDAITRERRLANYLNIGLSIVGIAAFFVPPVGAAMLLITADQLLFETIEGARELSQGDKEAGWAHITDVLENLATMAALAPVFHYTVSPFIEGLKSVTLPSGKTRLWKPDLKPYERNVKLPANARPDESGLHRHAGEDILPLEGKHYALKKQAGTVEYRIQHPTRTDAYQPELNHNGNGAWNHEVEAPLEWSKQTLLRRLGHSVDSFTENERENLLKVSGTQEEMLRRMHVESEPPPPLLADTITRFQAYSDAGEVGAQIRSGQLQSDLCGYAASLMVELPGWPRTKAIEAFESADLSGKSVQYGDSAAPASDVITVSRAELMAGQLPERVLSLLSEEQTRHLVGQHVAPDQQAQTLKALLADHADKARARIFQSLSKEREELGNPRTQLVQRSFSSLSTRLAKDLLKDATPDELRQMKTARRLPLRLAQKARLAQQEVRLSRAYEGLFLGTLAAPDTESLVLHTLKKLLAESGNLRIEVREGSFTGAIRASIGPEDALERKVLVRTGDGQYEARDASDNHLHGRDDLYAALQHALPDAQRRSLSLPHVNQGADLEALIQQHALARDELRSVLNMQAQRQPFLKPLTLLPDGRRGYPLSGRGGYHGIADEPLLRQRVRSLYPGFSDEQIGGVLGPVAEAAEARVSALEAEFNQLNSTLQRWMNSPTLHNRFGPLGVAQWQSRNALYKAIRQCWQRTGPAGIDAPGIIGAQSLDLNGISMGRHLASFPELTANFDHVTSLSMCSTNMLSSQGAFLEKFPGLRSLNLSDNLLNRLPPAIGDLRHLTQLGLENNQIVLTEQAVARLRGLTQLEVLQLANNPLGRVPDISLMSRLAVLNLERTGIDQWPIGLFGKSRPRQIYLNLRYNRLTHIPDIAPGSFRAELLGRTIVSREPEWVSPSVLEKLKHYLESVGMDPQRPYPPRGLLDSLKWAQGMPDSLFRERLIIWDELEDEMGSEKFFDVIRRLTQSADFNTAETSYRSELTAKVWRMLEAMHNDPELRETAFSESVVVTECSDGATQLFNALGVKVLVKEAYALENPALIEAELVELARGKSRLDELGAIARRRIAARYESGERFRRVDANGDVTGTIDEVEVQLAYMTELAEKLDLPWQSRGMLFRAISGVTSEMIEAARLHVLGLEQGDLLEETILQQTFWDDYLENTYRDDIARKKLELRNEDEMVQFTAIKELKKTWTSQAIERAKLRRTEIPFTVQADS